MDILGGLPVWLQLVIAVLVAAVLVVMNVGWLMQARSWLGQQGKRRSDPTRPTSPPPASTTGRDRV